MEFNRKVIPKPKNIPKIAIVKGKNFLPVNVANIPNTIRTGPNMYGL
jgi:hypothetical protein